MTFKYKLRQMYISTYYTRIRFSLQSRNTVLYWVKFTLHTALSIHIVQLRITFAGNFCVIIIYEWVLLDFFSWDFGREIKKTITSIKHSSCWFGHRTQYVLCNSTASADQLIKYRIMACLILFNSSEIDVPYNLYIENRVVVFIM